MRTIDGQIGGLMDQSFTLIWFLTTAFYEASFVTKFGRKTGGGGGARPHPPASPLATALAGDNHAKLIFSRSLWREVVYEVFQFFLSRLLAEFNLQLIFSSTVTVLVRLSVQTQRILKLRHVVLQAQRQSLKQFTSHFAVKLGIDWTLMTLEHIKERIAFFLWRLHCLIVRQNIRL